MVTENPEEETFSAKENTEAEYLTPAQWVEKAIEEYQFEISDGHLEEADYHFITLENFTDFIEQFAMRGEESGKIGISPFYMQELLLDKFDAKGTAMCDDNQKLYYCYTIRLLDYKTTKAFSNYCGIRKPVQIEREAKEFLFNVANDFLNALIPFSFKVKNR